jgi:hypothetical protein
MRRRGQASVESLMTVVFAVLILTVVSILAMQKSNEANDLKTKTDARRVLDILVDNVNNIAGQGSGFYRYFTLPETLYGDREYNISIYGNLAELGSGDYADTRELRTSNITVICMDKDLRKSNKVYSDQEKIYIICDKPELIVVNGSFRPFRAVVNDTMNVSVTIMNFGPAGSGQFNVSINNTTQVVVPSLASEEKVVVSAWINAPAKTGPYNIPIVVDSGYAVDESIESNNVFNATINVV